MTKLTIMLYKYQVNKTLKNVFISLKILHLLRAYSRSVQNTFKWGKWQTLGGKQKSGTFVNGYSVKGLLSV